VATNAFGKAGAFGLEFFRRTRGRLRWRVAAIEKPCTAMRFVPWLAARSSHREDVALVAVHAAGLSRPKHVKGRIRAVPRRIHQVGPDWRKKLPSGDSGSMRVKSWGRCAGTDIHVPDFGIAHLIVRAGGRDGGGSCTRYAVVGQQTRQLGACASAIAVVFAFFAMAQPSRISSSTGLGRTRRHLGKDGAW